MGIFAIVFKYRIKTKLYGSWTNFIIECKYDDEPTFNKIEYDNRNSNDKYLAIGFDDFRDSDFMMVVPIFASHNAYDTYNTIPKEEIFDIKYISKIDYLIEQEMR